MISDSAPTERQIYVGLAWATGQPVQPVGLLKLARHGVQAERIAA